MVNSGLNPRDPQFWREVWEQAQKEAQKGEQRRNISPLEFWNRRAPEFAESLNSEGSRSRAERALAWMDRLQVLRPGMTVLDIGAGAGLFTLPLARRGIQVLALEPAPAMMEVLKKWVKKEGLSQVEFSGRLWEDIDPEAEGWQGRFDLVLASFSPGVKDVATLEKMMACSRQWCYLANFAGRRMSTARFHLWRQLFGRDPVPPGHEIMYPLNYLYALGYCPWLQMEIDDWGQEMTVEEAIAKLKNFFVLHGPLTPSMEEQIAAYVRGQGVEGRFREEHRVRYGMILWQPKVRHSIEEGAV